MVDAGTSVADGHGMRRAITGTVAALLLLLGSSSRAADHEPRAQGCSTYRSELKLAREQLERGDRQAAIATLRRAKVALGTCGEEQAPAARTGENPTA